MRVTVFHSKFRGLTESFMEGLRVRGCDVREVPVERYRKRGAVDFGVTVGAGGNVAQIHKDLADEGLPWLCITDGFVNRRQEWRHAGFLEKSGRGVGPYWGVARNGLHAYGEHVDLGYRGSARWDALAVQLKPWQKDGKWVVIGFQPYQRRWSQGPPKVDRNVWFEEMIKGLVRWTSGPIAFRPHPHEREDVMSWFERVNKSVGGRMTFMRGSMDRLFAEGVRLGITYDSNIAVDFAIEGVPFITGGPTMADQVCNRDLGVGERPAMPDRSKWAHWLAWQQWTRQEMREGLPWIYFVEEWER